MLLLPSSYAVLNFLKRNVAHATYLQTKLLLNDSVPAVMEDVDIVDDLMKVGIVHEQYHSLDPLSMLSTPKPVVSTASASILPLP
jgi:hypothetical protein